uniref:Signal peptide protein n=1 Tax=Heterorhabditis bacteriophora TaxID=37862 RepID=A0A1I7WEN6_HETBA
MTYCCCVCRASKNGARLAFGFCTSKSSARAPARRETIDGGNYLRENANMMPNIPSTTVVEQLIVGSSGSSDTLRRPLSCNRNYMKSTRPVRLLCHDSPHLLCVSDLSRSVKGSGRSNRGSCGGLEPLPLLPYVVLCDRASLRCVTDDEDVLLDSVVKIDIVAFLINCIVPVLSIEQFNLLYLYYCPNIRILVKLLMNFELGTIKAIESQLELKIYKSESLLLRVITLIIRKKGIRNVPHKPFCFSYRCTFNYKKCIKQRRDAVGLRSKTASDALVGTYFRRLRVLPFLAPHLLNISECLPGHACLRIGQWSSFLMTSEIIIEVHGSYLITSPISILIIVRISIAELPMLWKVATHESGSHFLVSHTLFHLLFFFIINSSFNLIGIVLFLLLTFVFKLFKRICRTSISKTHLLLFNSLILDNPIKCSNNTYHIRKSYDSIQCEGPNDISDDGVAGFLLRFMTIIIVGQVRKSVLPSTSSKLIQ